MFEINENDSFGLLEDDEFLSEICLDESGTTSRYLDPDLETGGMLQIENAKQLELNKPSESEFLNKFNLPTAPVPESSSTNVYLNTSATSCASLETFKTSTGNEEFPYGKKGNKRKLVGIFETVLPVKPKRERKFPGPAGLLPERKSGGITPAKLNSYLGEQLPQDTSMEDLCSQGRCSGSVLEEEPWQHLLADLGPDQNILEEVNVASLKRKAAARCFVGRKVPFLAAVLHHLDVSSPDPCIILRDVTGEIHGTLHREVWEKFAGELVIGSVLVVKNVGLLSTGTSLRRHYLNITANNLATIYSASTDKNRREWIYPFTSQDFVKAIQDWRSLVTASNGVRSPASPGLFNSSWNPASFDNTSLNSPVGITPPSRMSTSQNSQFKQIPQKTLGRNLLGSFSPNPLQPNRLHTNRLSLNPISNKPNSKTSSSSDVNSTEFHFNPIIVQPKKFNLDGFAKTNSATNGTQVPSQNRLIEIQTHSTKGINATVVMSQSSQLTAEEQSVVDSVFDGIDADSLFDDDF